MSADPVPAAAGQASAGQTPPAPVPVTHDLLPGRYVVERELGRGGMATVYLAHDRQHDAPVALKVMRHEFASLVGGERFAREIRITARLQHPHILPVLDSGVAGGVPFYTMPYVDGETLAARLVRERQLPVADALRVASEVADALAYAHARGFVHRDLKPANILLAGSAPLGTTGAGGTAGGAAHGAWHALLADFGIARVVDAEADERARRTGHGTAGGPDALTDSGAVIGTVSYMSPEQAAGERVDGRSDIYGLGCVLYEMLAGTPPFTGPSARAVLARHVVDPVPSLRTVRPAVSPGLEAVVATALAKVPADRFPDAAAFKAVLDAEALAAATGQRTGPWTGAAPRGERAPARRRVRLLAGAALALGVAAAGTLARRGAAPGAPALDAGRVVVFPLLATLGTAAAPTVGEDVATVIGSVLDGAGPLRAVDAWRLLPPARRDSLRGLGAAEAGALARGQGARYYLTGRIVPRGDSAEVALELQDALGDSTVARGAARGLARDAWRTGLRAVNGVLPRLIGTGSADVLAEWADRDPGAVASFLLGESAFRRLRLADALTHYRQAVRRDSSFALAALRGAQAASWQERATEAGALVDVALRRPLPPRYAHFARGYRAYVDGRADSAAAELRRALALDPQMAVAWMQLGEVYTHLLPAAGTPAASADSAFAEAHRLDPTASNLVFHLAEIRLRQGRLTDAASLVAQVLAAAPDSQPAMQLRLMDGCVRGGPARVDWAAAVRARPMAVLSAAKSLAVGLAQPACAEAAYAAVVAGDTAAAHADGPVERATALFGLAPLRLVRGDAAGAAAAVDASVARGDGGATFFLLAAPLAPALAGRTGAVAAAERARFGPAYAKCPSAERLTTLGRWAAQAGDAVTADAVARDLAARAARTPPEADPVLGPAVGAWAALARGDTAAAVAGFTAVLGAPMPSGFGIAWGTAEPRGAERLALARLFLARGQFQRALDVAGAFDGPAAQASTLYLPASLEVRAAAADALGTGAAASYRARLAAVRGGRAVAGGALAAR